MIIELLLGIATIVIGLGYMDARYDYDFTWLPRPVPGMPSLPKQKGMRHIIRSSRAGIAEKLRDAPDDAPVCPLYGWHAKKELPGTPDGCHVLREMRCVTDKYQPLAGQPHTDCPIYQLARKLTQERVK